MNLNLELWVAMAAAALFFHFANRSKAPAAVFVLASVAVSALVMLTVEQGYLAVLIGQVVLFAVIFAYLKIRK
jgi:hypothetical protein